jgi:hypothetical protein
MTEENGSSQHCIAKIGAGLWNLSFGSAAAFVPADVFQSNIGC